MIDLQWYAKSDPVLLLVSIRLQCSRSQITVKDGSIVHFFERFAINIDYHVHVREL
jgi:hypothetical protein